MSRDLSVESLLFGVEQVPIEAVGAKGRILVPGKKALLNAANGMGQSGLQGGHQPRGRANRARSLRESLPRHRAAGMGRQAGIRTAHAELRVH